MMTPLVLIIRALAQDDHEHEHEHAHECRPERTIALLCSNHTEDCGFTKSVVIPNGAHLHDMPDVCSGVSESCAMGKHEDGDLDGTCDFDPAMINSECAKDQHCVMEAAEACQAKDDHSCFSPCIWHANCAASDHYCEDHPVCNPEEGCGHTDLKCPALVESGAEFSHFNCAHTTVAEQLDEYCLDKDKMKTHNIVVYVLEIVAMLAIGFVVAKMGVGKHMSAKARGHLSLVSAALATYFLSLALTDTLHLATEFADRAHWQYSIPYSPHWVIFTMTCFTIFFFVHVFATFFAMKHDAKKRSQGAIFELFVEAFTLGCLIGGQWVVGTKYGSIICAIIYLFLRTSEAHLGTAGMGKAIMVGAAMAVPLFLGDFCTTNYFLSPATTLEGSSTFFAVMGAAQAVMCFFAISRAAHTCKNTLGVVLLSAAMIVGLLLCITAFYTRPHHSVAFNEMVMRNFADGLGFGGAPHEEESGHDHDH